MFRFLSKNCSDFSEKIVQISLKKCSVFWKNCSYFFKKIVLISLKKIVQISLKYLFRFLWKTNCSDFIFFQRNLNKFFSNRFFGKICSDFFEKNLFKFLWKNFCSDFFEKKLSREIWTTFFKEIWTNSFKEIWTISFKEIWTFFLTTCSSNVLKNCHQDEDEQFSHYCSSLMAVCTCSSTLVCIRQFWWKKWCFQ